MASQAIITFDKVKHLGISEPIEDSYQQIQLECTNGRRFILRGLRTTDLAKLETAMEIINDDKEINLSEWVEVEPAENSIAHKAMLDKSKKVA